ncbi:late embryogenesis abundant protein At5g17165-like [Solanum pennellii]|uniref:Late embryogenesis abundant protein At5g17165-like n=1 Tax=Solanum pennellii TaxID=28526 RepID=A0ABM1GZ15_SOLPN|nr:late embryogenesis abundant protein At5g17165-like [Solanum pennellii]
MATNLQKRGLVSLGKRFVNKITYSTSRNSANSSSTTLSGRNVVHTSVYDKNIEEYVSSWVPDEVIEIESDKYKYWTPHPQTGVFGPATDHIIKYGEYGSQFSTVDSVLEQKTFFRDFEDLEKPSYP